jgi:hypothetical protein
VSYTWKKEEYVTVGEEIQALAQACRDLAYTAETLLHHMSSEEKWQLQTTRQDICQRIRELLNPAIVVEKRADS